MRSYVAFVFLLALILQEPANAQDAATLFRRHLYTEAIDQLREKGGDALSLSDRDMVTLGLAHFRRASAYMAAYQFQVDAGLYWYETRAENKDAVTTPFDAYFLGRYQFEDGRYAEAEKQFGKASSTNGLPSAFRNRAAIWQTASRLQQGQSASWPQSTNTGANADLALAKWNTGVVDRPSCSGNFLSDGAAARCYLLKDAVTTTANTLPDHWGKIATSPPADAIHPVGELSFFYYDPATIQVLALADFRAALHAFSKVTSSDGRNQINLYSGAAAFELKLFEEALQLLNDTNMDERHAYLGAIAFETGERSNAEKHWTSAKNKNTEALVEWAHIASRYTEMEGDIQNGLRPNIVNSLSDLVLAHKTGGAFLNAGQYTRALALLERNYPAELNNDLNQIAPAFLIRLAHSRFLSGRSYFGLVNSHMYTIIQRFPAVLGLTEIVKASTSPNAVQGEIITDN